ncbi:hypothetical protein [Aphanizomenon flos-aquae]|uniref:hypothetical protein n=1 Tax=Aphanizomenon flos-aquae TaxID=1176 RepID=UPI000488E353|nr:hypothetical protein [Aphanizomenon flos-aquae]
MIIWQPEQQINNGRFIIQGKPLGSGGFGTFKGYRKILSQNQDVQDFRMYRIVILYITYPENQHKSCHV